MDFFLIFSYEILKLNFFKKNSRLTHETQDPIPLLGQPSCRV